MKSTKRIIALAVTMLMLAACLITTVPAETYTYAFDKIGTEQNINDDVTYQKYVLTSGENGTTVDAVAMEFDPADGYMPMAFMGYAGTSGTLATQYGVAVDKYGYEVVGAINGSFFSMDSDGRGAYGTLVDYIISNGKVMSAHAGDACEVVAFGEDGSFNVVSSCIDYKIYINGEDVGSLYYINKTSGTKTTANWGNGFYYYDTSCGKTADTNTSVEGYNVLCKKLDNTDLVVGGTLKGEVISVTKGTEAAQVSDGYDDVSDRFDIFVKATSPNSAYVKDLEAGDSINITVTETVEESREIIENANSVIENVGWLVKDGVDQTQIKSTIGTHSVTLKARWTAFGVKSDGSYVFFTSDSTVTAGDEYSTGNSPSATLRDVAKAMIELGCVDVIRMDGGGSVAMYAQDDGSGDPGYLMVTSGYIRPVADCILVVKKESVQDEDLDKALTDTISEANKAETLEAAVAAAVEAAQKYLDDNTVHISGTVRRLLMKLQSSMSGKDELNALIASASGVSFADYSAEVLENLRDAYETATAVFGDPAATGEEVTAAADELRYWLERTGPQDLNLSLGKSYTVEIKSGVNYTNFESAMVDDLKRLTDGKADSLEGTSPAYSAWQGAPEIVIDLGSVEQVDKFIVHAARMLDWGISTPRAVTVSVSEDGTTYTEVGKVTGTEATVEGKYTTTIGEVVNESSALGWNAYKITVEAENTVKARYVKFNFTLQGSFLWLTELEAYKSVDVITDGMYITGVNTTVYTDYAVIFTTAAGNLNLSSNNTRYTQNVILKWNEEENCYVVTSNSFGNGTAPNKVLASDEICFAVHGDVGSPGNVNRNKAAALKVGDKVGFYGVNIADGKVTIAPYAALITDDSPVVEPGKTVLGDVNGDGNIDAVDYAMAKRAVLKTYDLNAEQFKRADIDKDGEISAVDYAMIKRHVLGTYTIAG